MVKSEKELIEELIKKQQEFDNIASSYNKNSKTYLNNVSSLMDDDRIKQSEMMNLRVQIESEINDLGLILNDMHSLIQELNIKGNQTNMKNNYASAAIKAQTFLIEKKEKIYKESIQDFYTKINKEQKTALYARQQQTTYIIYIIISVIIIGIVISFLFGNGVSLMFTILIIILGVYVTWEFYKRWMYGAGDLANTGFNKIKGTFNLFT